MMTGALPAGAIGVKVAIEPQGRGTIEHSEAKKT
jgi:hypothetical protein